MDNASINILCTVIGAFIGIYGFLRLTKKDTEESTKDFTQLKTDMGYIKGGVDDIRLDIKAQANKIQFMSERITRVEESTKSAHHRLDELIKEKEE